MSLPDRRKALLLLAAAPLTVGGLAACTFMPSVGARQQLGAKVRSPAISTTQARQLLSGRRPSV